MKANELMIGDWVLHHNSGCIDAMNDTAPYDEAIRIERDDFELDECFWGRLDPIPLTTGILEKNGWKQTSKRDDERGTMEKWFLPNIAYAYCFSNNEIEFEIIGYGNNSHGRGKYRGILSSVHELQHCLKLVGIDKEITI